MGLPCTDSTKSNFLNPIYIFYIYSNLILLTFYFVFIRSVKFKLILMKLKYILQYICS